tara:strand:- start:674 stop:1816 length:1143 start_codon:yes stop_codon:yes gene_type:complete
MKIKIEIVNKWNQYLMIIIFLFILLSPTIQMITPFVSYGRLVKDFNEKRELTKLPDFEIEKIEELPNQLNNYINDNFEFRKWLIAWNNYIKVKFFKVSPVSNVTLGVGDWIFLTYKGVIENIEGKALFSNDELEKIKEGLEAKKEFLSQNGSSYYIAIAPNKSSIYPEYLPYSIDVVDKSRTDQLINYIRQNSSIKIIDMRFELKKDKINNQLYYKTDSHWNHNGGFIGYEVIMNELKKDYPQLNVYSKNDFIITSDTLDKGGDVSQMLALRNEYKKIDYIYTPKEIIPKTNVNWHRNYKSSKGVEIFTTVTERVDTNLPRLINFHDSFTGYLTDFIPLHFSKSILIWSHEFKKEIIKQEKPDIVLHTIVERDIHLLGDM